MKKFLDETPHNANEGWYVVLVPKSVGAYQKQGNVLVPTAQLNAADMDKMLNNVAGMDRLGGGDPNSLMGTFGRITTP